MPPSSLPIVDISGYRNDPDSSASKALVQRLRDICHHTGFFYLVGHDIAPTLEQDVLSIANQFFALPLADREAIAIARSPHFRGYTLLNSEMTAGKSDWRDQIDIGPEEPAPKLSVLDPPWLKLRGPNQWPQQLPMMPGVMNAWMAAVQPLGLALMQALAEGLGQPRNYFDERMSVAPYTRVKVIRYPSVTPQDNSDQGLGLHHDSGVLTLILQDAVPGLQVMSQGKLIDVEPIAGAYVVNLGEMMQAATNGYFKATKHQVKSPANGQQRISVAYFLNPGLDAEFSPIALPAELADLAPGGQNPNPDDPVFRTFGANTLKIRMRAHPDVTAAHYADVDLANLS